MNHVSDSAPESDTNESSGEGGSPSQHRERRFKREVEIKQEEAEPIGATYKPNRAKNRTVSGGQKEINHLNQTRLIPVWKHMLIRVRNVDY